MPDRSAGSPCAMHTLQVLPRPVGQSQERNGAVQKKEREGAVGNAVMFRLGVRRQDLLPPLPRWELPPFYGVVQRKERERAVGGAMILVQGVRRRGLLPPLRRRGAAHGVGHQGELVPTGVLATVVNMHVFALVRVEDAQGRLTRLCTGTGRELGRPSAAR